MEIQCSHCQAELTEEQLENIDSPVIQKGQRIFCDDICRMKCARLHKVRADMSEPFLVFAEEQENRA